jgi:hypothetical protein
VVFEPALPQAELAARLRAADLVLVPSRSETFGLIALEAQACGTPVVAARVPGLEVVVGGGGVLVDGHDPADHARRPRAARRPGTAWRRRARAGLEDAAASSWERTVDRLLDAYAAVRHARMRERRRRDRRRPRGAQESRRLRDGGGGSSAARSSTRACPSRSSARTASSRSSPASTSAPSRCCCTSTSAR